MLRRKSGCTWKRLDDDGVKAEVENTKSGDKDTLLLIKMSMVAFHKW